MIKYCLRCGELFESLEHEGLYNDICKTCVDYNNSLLYIYSNIDNEDNNKLYSSNGCVKVSGDGDGGAGGGGDSGYVLEDSEARERYRHRAHRFYRKAVTGIAVADAKQMHLRWWTFTESNEAIKSGKKVWFELRMARQWLRRRYGGDVQMAIIEHRGKTEFEWMREFKDGESYRHDFHCLEYGLEKIDVDELNEFWERNYLSFITGMKMIEHPMKAVNYLSEYLKHGEKYVQSRFTRNFVFPGWWEYGAWYKRNISIDGRYPDMEHFVRLALMNEDERMAEDDYSEYVLRTAKELWEVRIPQLKRKLEKRGVPFMEREVLLEDYKRRLLKGEDVKI